MRKPASNAGALTPEELARIAAEGGLQARKNALHELYCRYATRVHRICATRLRDAQAAEDAAMQTWLKVAKGIGRYNPDGGSFEPWLATVARNCAADHLKVGHRMREVPTSDMLAIGTPSPDETPEDAALRTERAEALVAALERLPTKQRQAVLYRFFHGLTVAETAAMMGKTEGAITQLQHRGVGTLRKFLPGSIVNTAVAVEPSAEEVDRNAVHPTLPGAPGL